MASKEDRVRLISVTMEDCDFETFRCGGKGGQNVNKRDTGARIRHRASGAVGESREGRTQWQNKQKAFRRMAESKTFQNWLKIETARRSGWNIEKEVAKALEDRNLKVECRDADTGRWAPFVDSVTPEA